jgi:Predicted enzyme related to lactoylglutathione lyase
MSEGIKTVIYPASDLARAKAAFSAVLGTAPDMDEPYYVQFNVNGQAIGLTRTATRAAPSSTTTSPTSRARCRRCSRAARS